MADEDQKIGWSGNVVSINLVGDGASSSGSSDEDGYHYANASRRKRRRKRRQDAVQNLRIDPRADLFDPRADLFDPEAYKDGMGVARMPGSTGSTAASAASLPQHLIVLDDSPLTAPAAAAAGSACSPRKRRSTVTPTDTTCSDCEVVELMENNVKATPVNNCRVRLPRRRQTGGGDLDAETGPTQTTEGERLPSAAAHVSSEQSHNNDEIVICETRKCSEMVVHKNISPTEQIMELFPDADLLRVQNLLLQNGMSPQDLDRKVESSHQEIVQSVVSILTTEQADDDDDEVIVCETRKAATTSTSNEVEILSVRSTPMQRILEVFPDVDMSHAESLLVAEGVSEEYLRQPVHDVHETLIQNVLVVLSESSYPKSKNSVKTAAAAVVDTTIVQARTGVLKTYKHDYMSSSSFEPAAEYISQACLRLETDFPFLPKRCIKKHLAIACKQHYAICHDSVMSVILNKSATAKSDDDDEKEFQRVKRALDGHPIPHALEKQLLKLKGVTSVLKRPRKNQAPYCITDRILKDEVMYVNHKHKVLIEELHAKALRAVARKESERVGSTMECQCCYGDVAMEEMISCKEEGHLFCVDCLRRFAENQVFGQGNLGIDKSTNSPALELKCMHGDGCSSGFEHAHLRKALPEKVMAKYDELAFRAAVEKAGVQDMCTCPKCGFQAVLPPTEMIFRCPVADCLNESCRKCGEEPHIPLRCEEVEKQHETKGRLKVEEAISAAKIRTCPKPGCGKKFVKSDGCNKMTCACGTFLCYVCRAEIPKNVGYQHFCQTAHCDHKRCGKCVLYSKAEEDDARAMREAGIKAAEEVREASLLNGTAAVATQNGTAKKNPDTEVRINVDSLLENPNVNFHQQQQQQHPVAGVLQQFVAPRQVASAVPQRRVRVARRR